jgi:2-oxoglutarate ferredoxin oxidoreductase subunit alpha
MQRGKVLSAEELASFKEKYNGERWGRYLDVDGDGVPYRTLPGTPTPQAAYFTRGTGHNEYAVYSERSDVWERGLKRLAVKWDTARELVPSPIVDEVAGARVAILSVGSNDPAVQEARARLRKAGVETSYLRLRALPFNHVVSDFIAAYDKVYVVENNFDGQLHSILSSELPALATRLVSLAKCDGLPLSARWITEQIA